jgi:hypothetical protein
MKATVTIQALIANYKKFIAGELYFTNHNDKFFSELICHHIGEMLVPKLSKDAIYKLSYGSINTYGISKQFREQWFQLVLKKDVSIEFTTIENWNTKTEYAASVFGMELDDPADQDYQWRKQYRLKCLEKAAEENPELVFTFSNVLR